MRFTLATGSTTSVCAHHVYGPRQDYHGAYIAVIMKMLDVIGSGRTRRTVRRRQSGVRLRLRRGLRRGQRVRDEGKRDRSFLQRGNRRPHLTAGARRARPEGHGLRRRDSLRVGRTDVRQVPDWLARPRRCRARFPRHRAAGSRPPRSIQWRRDHNRGRRAPRPRRADRLARHLTAHQA